MSAQALKKFTAQAEQAQAKIDKFQAELSKDPAHALTWSNGVFQSAARLKVANMLVEAFSPREGAHEYTVANAVSHLTDRVMGMARYPAQSTSPTSNLMEQYEAAAFAEALDELKYISE
jgi:hypothetical protein